MSFRETLTKVRVITANGTFEFSDIKEAHKSFPTLDINRGCRKFTAAMEDGDYLLFESWDINHALDMDE
jgi:hypothetical protein